VRARYSAYGAPKARRRSASSYATIRVYSVKNSTVAAGRNHQTPEMTTKPIQIR